MSLKPGKTILKEHGKQPAGHAEPRRFVVLDRDGTIIEEQYYLSIPEGVSLIPGAAAGLRQLMEMSLGLVVITNQSGIGRGYFDQTSLDRVHQRTCQLLAREGVWLDGIYFCPHVPEDQCSCRKPETGLLEQAARELGFSPEACFVIGDKACDIEMGQRVGATTFLVRTGYGARVASDSATLASYIVDDLQEAAPIITNLIRKAR